VCSFVSCAGNLGMHAGEAERIVLSTISSRVCVALLQIPISITALQQRAVRVREALNHTV